MRSGTRGEAFARGLSGGGLDGPQLLLVPPSACILRMTAGHWVASRGPDVHPVSCLASLPVLSALLGAGVARAQTRRAGRPPTPCSTCTFKRVMMTQQVAMTVQLACAGQIPCRPGAGCAGGFAGRLTRGPRV